MAATGFSSTGGWFDTGYGLCRLHGEIVYNVTRSNNTVSFTNTYARLKYVRESGNWVAFTYGSGWTWNLYIDYTWRAGNTLSGTRNVDQIDDGTVTSFAITTTALATSISASIGAYFSGDAQTYADKTLYFPAAGYPAGQTASSSLVAATTARVSASLSNWGDYCTAGTGQRIEYKKHSDSTWTNLAYSTNASHYRDLTGLTPGTLYDVRTYTVNGAGLTGNSSTVQFTTLSIAKKITTGGVTNVLVKKITTGGVVTCMPTKVV